MGMEIITGHRGTNHVGSDEIGAQNAGMFGNGKYVFDLGEKFAYEIISNNLVRIKNGYGINQGRSFGIAVNDYEEVVIDNGLAGVSRLDLIVARYTKVVETGIENVSLVVIKGTSAETPTPPTYNTGNILNGEVIDDFPLWRVGLNGLNIQTVTQQFEVAKSAKSMNADTLGIIGALSSLTTTIKTSIVNSINWLNTKFHYSVASEYSSLNTYDVGAYKYHENILYKCTVAINTPEEWNPSHWEQAWVANEVRTINTNLSKVSLTKELSASNFAITTINTHTKVINDTTIAETGLYIVGFDVGLGGVSTSNRLLSIIYKNGVAWLIKELPVGQGYSGASLCLPVNLTSNDVLYLTVFSDVVISANSANTAKLNVARLK